MKAIAMLPHYVRTTNRLPVDIDKGLFGGFFRDEAYQAWASGRKSWHLHLFGSPGCGKTMLTSLIANHLKKNTVAPVATIYITEGAGEEESLTAEVILQTIQAQIEGQHGTTSTTCSGFVLLDGFDELSESVQESLQGELSRSSSNRYNVLLTRRVPSFVQPIPGKQEVCSCDGPNCADRTPPSLNLFWECTARANNGVDPCAFMLCYECYGSGEKCPDPGHAGPMVEPYAHRNIEVTVDATALKQYVHADLEREFGGSNISSEVVDAIVEKSENNMVVAKLRLDHVRELSSPRDASDRSDRLPRGVVALYEREISRLQARSVAQRKQLLAAIVAVASMDQAEKTFGELEDQLRNINAHSPEHVRGSALSVKEVLRLARGLLWMDLDKITLYHLQLRYYVREDYNEELMEAKGMLKACMRFVRPPIFPLSRQSTTDSGYFSAIASPSQLSRVNTPSEAQYTKSTPTSGNSTMSMPVLNRRRHVSLPHGMNAETRVAKSIQAQDDAKSVCSFCEETILYGKALYGVHHRSIEDLAASAESGCIICNGIRKYATSTRGDAQLPSIDASKLPHTWSLRTTGSTRTFYPSTTIVLCPASPQAGTSPHRYHLISTSHVDHMLDSTHLPPSTRLDDAGPQITSWLQTCNTKHAYCTRPAPQSWIPTRLVRLPSSTRSSTPPTITVVSTANTLPVTTPYATLSHCWGTVPFFTLTRHTEAQLTITGVPLAQLSTNFQHAVEVARFIGVEYIWIDSLCIMQGEGGDFETEGQLMHAVYRNSYCNIVAADSHDGTGGLFRPRNKGGVGKASSEILSKKYRSGAASLLGVGEWKILTENVYVEELLGAPIYERGWVFQERMLSPRLLHFTRGQIFWDCSTLSACEAFPTGLPYHLDQHASIDRHWRARLRSTSPSYIYIGGPNDASPETIWRTAVQKYTACSLTNQLDKTVAIWSVAKILRDLLPASETYGGGLWSTALAEQLSWRVATPTKSKRLADLQTGWPSWSWASVYGEVIAGVRLVHPRCYVVKQHNGVADVAFELQKAESQDGESRDRETKVQPDGAIEMSGYMGSEAIVHDAAIGAYRFNTAANGAFTVFPDEPLDAADLSPNVCRFIVLAASIQDPYAALRGAPPTDEHAEGVRYSGIGLILVSLSEFVERKLERYEAQLETLGVERDRLAEELGHLIAGRAEQEKIADKKKWYDIIEKRISGLSAWIDGMKRKARGDSEQDKRRFRRIGVLRFWDVNEGEWARISGRRENIWLE